MCLCVYECVRVTFSVNWAIRKLELSSCLSDQEYDGRCLKTGFPREKKKKRHTKAALEVLSNLKVPMEGDVREQSKREMCTIRIAQNLEV